MQIYYTIAQHINIVKTSRRSNNEYTEMATRNQSASQGQRLPHIVQTK